MLEEVFLYLGLANAEVNTLLYKGVSFFTKKRWGNSDIRKKILILDKLTFKTMILENEIGITSFRNEWQKASVSILYTYGFLSNGYESFFKKYNLTSQQYNALCILRDQFPKPVSTSFLREKMLDRMSDASRLVSRLSAKNLVTVTQNPADKRLVNILISAEGQKMCNLIDQDLPSLDFMLQGISEEEASTLVELLFKVRESIRTVEERAESLEKISA